MEQPSSNQSNSGFNTTHQSLDFASQQNQKVKLNAKLFHQKQKMNIRGKGKEGSYDSYMMMAALDGKFERGQSQSKLYESGVYGLRDSAPWNARAATTMEQHNYSNGAYARTSLSKDGSSKPKTYAVSQVQMEPLLIEESKGSMNVYPISITQQDQYQYPQPMRAAGHTNKLPSS